MQFSSPLLTGTLIKRYKRFLADIQLDSGEIVTAHCANSGAMLDITTPGERVWVSHEDSPTRKLKYSWHIVKVDGVMIGMNTSWPNLMAYEAIQNGTITQLQGYESIRREVKYGQNSRIDLLLSAPDKPDCYVEVKNVHLKREHVALFPDSVTSRGAKHLHELADVVANGMRAVMLYVIQRDDCTSFDLARDIDPTYVAAADFAFAKGVEAYAYDCSVAPVGIEMRQELTVMCK